jgi:small redox-active disulfide protein 2
MKIQIYGTGCPRCRQLEATTREALGTLRAPAEVEKVEDINAITAAGVLRTPALAIDGKLMVQGRVPGVRELAGMLTKAGARAVDVSGSVA